MTENLNIEGALEETTVPDLFRSLVRSRETALLSLEAIERHDAIFFEEGAIVSAGSSDPDHSLATVLLRSGELSLREFQEASERIAGETQMESVLCELGFLTPDELNFSEERKIANIVKDAVLYRAGRYSIDFVPQLPTEVRRHRVETARLIMNGIEQIESWTLISRGIGRIRSALRQVSGADARVFSLEVTEEEMHLYSTLTEPQTIEALCERSYLSNFQTCRTVWALWAVDLIEESDDAANMQQRADTEEELELESMVERYNSAFMLLYALVLEEMGDDVVTFIEGVMRHLSPDRLPFLSGITFANEARVDFDQLLNNLIASRLEDRMTIANDVLNQLLYGWIVETREAFGSRLHDRVDAIVAPLREGRP